LQGQTVTQWPFVFPVDRECLIDLHILARLDAAPAEDALAGIIPIEGVSVVHLVRLRLKGDLLMFNREQLRRVVDGAVAVVVVANGAIEQVVGENPVERLPLCGRRGGGPCRHRHAFAHHGGAGPDELSVHFDHARVAGLERAKLRVVAHSRQFDAAAGDDVDEAFAGLCFLDGPVNHHADHCRPLLFWLRAWRRVHDTRPMPRYRRTGLFAEGPRFRTTSAVERQLSSTTANCSRDGSRANCRFGRCFRLA
jgi:hypothetical protein